MTPTIGRIVIYNTNEMDRAAIAATHGNTMSKLPAIVTAAWSEDVVNLKVIGDGHIDLWKTSVHIKDEVNIEGTWEWPQIVK